jgi:ferritin
MPGIAVKPSVIVELQRQLNHELSAAHSYLALAAWCEEQNFKGFGHYFHKQAGEEREHAERIMKHLLDRGVLPELAQVATPKIKFMTILEIAKHAQAMEQANTVGINAAYEAALRDKDFPAQVMLQWFITEQVEEEDWADEMVDRVEKASCAGGLMDLDRHIERYLSDEVIGAEGKA